MTAHTVGDVMTTPVQDIGPDAPLALAARRLVEEKVRRLLVVDDAGHLAARVPGVVGVTNNIRAADDASG